LRPCRNRSYGGITMNSKVVYSVGTSATLKATTTMWPELGGLIVLFLASIVYVASGGPFLHDASPILEPEASFEVAALTAANADIAPPAGSGSGR
jgi:hypothetical protein